MSQQDQYNQAKVLAVRKSLYTYASRPDLQEGIFELLDVAPGMRVLDAGCGLGNDLLELAQQYPNLTLEGFDGSAEHIATARERANQQNADITYAHQDINNTSLTGPYDRILMRHVLHLLEKPWEIFDHFRQLLTPTGKFIIVLHCAKNLERFDTVAGEVARAFDTTYQKSNIAFCVETETKNISERGGSIILHTQRLNIPVADPLLAYARTHRARFIGLHDDEHWDNIQLSLQERFESIINQEGTWVDDSTNAIVTFAAV